MLSASRIQVLLLAAAIVAGCGTQHGDDQKVGDCERGENYQEEYVGFVTVMDTNITLFKDTHRYKLKWIGLTQSPETVSDDIYYTDKIIGIEFKLNPTDTLKVKAIEHGHDEGACGPQQDSVQFIFQPPALPPSVPFRDSTIIGTWKGDWYKGDRIELLLFDNAHYVRRNYYQDGTYHDHPLWKVDSSGTVSYVKLDDDRLEYYRILDDRQLGVFSKYVMVETIPRK